MEANSAELTGMPSMPWRGPPRRGAPRRDLKKNIKTLIVRITQQRTEYLLKQHRNWIALLYIPKCTTMRHKIKWWTQRVGSF